MKILLTTLNARYTHSCLALYYLRESIADLPHTTTIQEFSINQEMLEVLQAIYRQAPDMIAFSVYIWNSRLIHDLIREIKKVLPKTIIIAGGPEISYHAQRWHDDLPEIDFIITGQGEDAFRHLVTHYKDLSRGIIQRKHRSFALQPFPYREEDFLSLQHKYIYYESSRGCPFSCSYCLSSRDDQKLEYKSLEQVKEELSLLLAANPRIIKFIDRSFNVHPERARSIWKFILEHPAPTMFHFEIHPQFLGNEDFEILSACPPEKFQFEIGIQSTHAATLDEIKRNTYWEHIEPKLNELLLLQNIHIHLDLIAGLPYESLDVFRHSFDNVYNLHPDHLQLGFLKVLPGTEMETRKNMYGIQHLAAAPYTVLSNKWLTFQEVCLIHNVETVISSIYNNHYFETSLGYLVACFPSAWNFYTSLSEFFERKELAAHVKDWKKIACDLLAFAEENDSIDVAYLQDLLRWDWCLYSASSHYPDFLNSTLLATAREEGHALLKELVHIIPDAIPLSSKELHTVLFFRTVNVSFQKQVMNHHTDAAFIPRKGASKLVLLIHHSR